MRVVSPSLMSAEVVPRNVTTKPGTPAKGGRCISIAAGTKVGAGTTIAATALSAMPLAASATRAQAKNAKVQSPAHRRQAVGLAPAEASERAI
jgi:hypothetical protein